MVTINPADAVKFAKTGETPEIKYLGTARSGNLFGYGEGEQALCGLLSGFKYRHEAGGAFRVTVEGYRFRGRAAIRLTRDW